MVAQRSRKSGVSLMESLMATLIIAVCLMAIINVFGFAYQMTVSTNDEHAAYNIARDSIEQIRLQGFYNANEGTTTAYYRRDNSFQPGGQDSNSRYKVVTTVKTDIFTTTSSGTYPATDSIRTVVVTVTNLSTGKQVCSMGTNLVSAGI